MFVVHIIMNSMHSNVELNLVHLKTAIKTLNKVSTWELKLQLLHKALHILKGMGKNCMSLLQEIKDKSFEVRAQIKEMIPKLLTYPRIDTRCYSRTTVSSTLSFIRKAVHIALRMAEMILLYDTISSPRMGRHNEKSMVNILIDRDQCILLADYLVLIDLHWENYIRLTAFIALRLHVIFNERIDTIIEQTSPINGNDMTLSEKLLLVEFIIPQLAAVFDELCALLLIFRIYLNVSESFLFPTSDHFLLKNSDGNNTGINDWAAQIIDAELQVKQIIQHCEKSYIPIFQQQHIEFHNTINEIRNIA